MEQGIVKIGRAAEILGLSRQTLFKWASSGEMWPARKSHGGTRYDAMSDIFGVKSGDMPTVCYARVSSHDQKADLEREQAALEAYCAAKGWQWHPIKDFGIGHYLPIARKACMRCWRGFFVGE